MITEHHWELRSGESSEHRLTREELERNRAEGLVGPFRKLWEASTSMPPSVKLRKYWECSRCGAKIAAVNEFENAAPSPKAILSTPLVANFDVVLYPNGGKGSYVVLKRGKSASRQYLDCGEFIVAAVLKR